MARPKSNIPPKYGRAGDRARVIIDGKPYMLGKYGSPESHALYERHIAAWRQGIEPVTPTQEKQRDAGQDNGEMLIAQLVVMYQDYANSYYRKHDEPTSEADCIRAAIQVALRLYGNLPVSAFTPGKLLDVQKAMVSNKWTRATINKHVHRVKRMFRWGVVNELVHETVYNALRVVPQIPRGRFENVKESKPVEPVPDWMIDAVKDHVPAPVWAMIELQRYSGMRPGEVVIMRAGDIEAKSQDAWVYRPHRHKKEHFGQPRPVVIGPRGIAVLQEWIKACKPGEYLFSPSEAERQRHDALASRFNENDRYFPSERKRAEERRSSGKIATGTAEREPGARYTEQSYRRCIQRACGKARAAAAKENRTGQLGALEDWTPNQIRHAVGTRIRERFGLDGAQVVLGHEHAVTTEIYADTKIEQAIEIMRKVG